MSDSISDLQASFFEALKKDDVDSVRKFRSMHPEKFEGKALSKLKLGNPLVVACEHGSRRVAQNIASDYPEFLQVKDQRGYTPLHWTCSRGDLPLVEIFVKLDSKICLIKDKFSRIPLHLAVMGGYEEVIKVLIAACPDSIGTVTSQRETAFHLAAKEYQSNAFEVLLEESHKLKEEHLLHRKDRQGNNILHIAASNNLIGIVQLLFPRVGRALVRVNTLNKKRLTALDVHYRSTRDRAVGLEIGHILREAGGLEARSLPIRAHIRWTLETKNVILVVLGIITGAAFTTVCNLPSSFLKDDGAESEVFQARDVISGHLPSIFYLMVFNTAILLASMGAIVVLLWSLPFRPVVVFLSITISIVYGLLVKNIMPKFLVTVGNQNHHILGNCLAWFLAVAFNTCGAITYYSFSFLHQFTKRVIAKTRRAILSSTHATPIICSN